MKIILLLSGLFISHFTFAQSAEDSVRSVIDKMFLSMKNSDSSTLVSCFADSAILQTIAKKKNGEIIIRNENVREFGHSISTIQKGYLDERISYDVIRTDGDLAIVWTPYSFYFNGKFSHCGVNSFQLIRQINGWKIQYLIDTRRREGCK